VDITLDLVDGYSGALESWDPVLLRAAVDELITVSRWMPKPAEILQVAKRLQSESSPKEAEPEHWRRDCFKCLTCRDTAYVAVWSAPAMRWALCHVGSIKRDREPARRLHEDVARCTCPRGQSRGGSTATYDPEFHVLVEGSGILQKVDRLVEWARSWKPANYVHELAQFNQESF
jgi:hypothetical protein